MSFEQPSGEKRDQRKGRPCLREEKTESNPAVFTPFLSSLTCSHQLQFCHQSRHFALKLDHVQHTCLTEWAHHSTFPRNALDSSILGADFHGLILPSPNRHLSRMKNILDGARCNTICANHAFCLRHGHQLPTLFSHKSADSSRRP